MRALRIVPRARSVPRKAAASQNRGYAAPTTQPGLTVASQWHALIVPLTASGRVLRLPVMHKGAQPTVHSYTGQQAAGSGPALLVHLLPYTLTNGVKLSL